MRCKAMFFSGKLQIMPKLPGSGLAGAPLLAATLLLFIPMHLPLLS